MLEYINFFEDNMNKKIENLVRIVNKILEYIKNPPIETSSSTLHIIYIKPTPYLDI